MSDSETDFNDAVCKVSSALTRLKAQKKPSNNLKILELEFGLGLNFWALLSFWHENPEKVQSGLRLDYFALSQQPLSREAIALLARHFGQHSPGCDWQTIADSWPLPAPGLHCLELASGRIKLWLWYGPLERGLKQLRKGFDWVLSPTQELPPQARKLLHVEPSSADKSPSLSSERTLSSTADISQTADARKTSDASRSVGLPAVSQVAIVGAGIAGASVARALCRRGVHVTLYERADKPAQGASGNWAGAFHPHFTKDDTVTSQLTRLGCEFTLQTLKALSEKGFLKAGRDWQVSGHYQTLEADELARTQAAFEALALPAELFELRSELTGAARQSIQRPGLYMQQGAWIRPPAWVQACLQDCGERLALKFNTDLTSLPEGFDAVVIAAAQHSVDLIPEVEAFVSQVKGQITRVRQVDSLPCVLSGASYAIDPQDGSLVLGATYERPVLNLDPSDAADHENIDRFRQLAPSLQMGAQIDRRCAVRSVWRDRLPAVGPVPGRPGVYLCTGFASRGLTWAAMAAESLADEMLGQGIRHRLLDRIKPERFLR